MVYGTTAGFQAGTTLLKCCVLTSLDEKVIILVFAALSLYWRVVYNVENNLRALEVHVVHCDGGVPPHNHVAASIAGLQCLTWCLLLGRWAAIIVHPNPTTLLFEPVRSGNASYDPTRPVQYVLSSDSNGERPSCCENWRCAFCVLGPRPALFKEHNRSPLTATLMVTIWLICLIIVVFSSFSCFLKYVKPRGYPPLHIWHLTIWWFATLTLYLFISLTYSLVFLTFGLPFSAAPGSATEVTVDATAHGRGPFLEPWTALWIIFWARNSRSYSLLVLEKSRGYIFPFRLRRARPLYDMVWATRHIVFDLKSEASRAKGRYRLHIPEGDHEFPRIEGEQQSERKRGFMRRT
ncbi:MNNG and nitrosoguanidine resistance protein [Xylaria telfairii]|nr:MNNG and nitrosoguanidine resistance protein [Xylaria telfairii]